MLNEEFFKAARKEAPKIIMPTDLSKVTIDTSLPKEKRLQKFAADIKNPYIFASHDLVVSVSMNDNGPSFKEAFTKALNSI